MLLLIGKGVLLWASTLTLIEAYRHRTFSLGWGLVLLGLSLIGFVLGSIL